MRMLLEKGLLRELDIKGETCYRVRLGARLTRESRLDVWKALPPRNFPNYAAGTWGPKEADDLVERDGRRWRNFEK
jgi:hypothetical protein